MPRTNWRRKSTRTARPRSWCGSVLGPVSWLPFPPEPTATMPREKTRMTKTAVTDWRRTCTLNHQLRERKYRPMRIAAGAVMRVATDATTAAMSTNQPAWRRQGNKMRTVSDNHLVMVVDNIGILGHGWVFAG